MPSREDNISRRRFFFYGSLLAGAIPAAGCGSAPSLPRLGYKSPNEKLNIAAIGAGGRAAGNIRGCESENIVALCDVDDKQAAKTYAQFEKAAKYKDFRKMLDKEGKNIDAVIISPPDHMHATAAMWCMERGLGVYVEKPLTRTVWEARQLTQAAEKHKVATQMGNQGYSNEGTRLASEIIWSGEIGNVTEVHAWTNRPIWPQGISTIPPANPVPSTLDWDLWLGIAQERPYTSGGAAYAERNSKFYLPFNWRGFFDFGCGALGDMACHILGAPNMALMLGAPSSVEVIRQEGKNDLTFPSSSVIRFDFPARGSMSPLKLFWYDAVKDAPMRPEGLAEDEMLIGPGLSVRPETIGGRTRGRTDTKAVQTAPAEPMRRPSQANGAVFIGEKGILTTDSYAGHVRLLPSERMQDFRNPPKFLTRSPGHHRDWIRACKGGDQACSNFSVAGPFTEWILLGSIALHFEGKLEWDAKRMRFTNNNEANKYLKPEFRKDWKFNAV
ncbi:MAG: Gfo/Idh/MocA family oxidoreductase [Candidatus Glassbacteria bacterium]|nr:Gfo/Idh/MocA family oxidoreductase [Candidatus Glassbacteria bacterium]